MNTPPTLFKYTSILSDDTTIDFLSLYVIPSLETRLLLQATTITMIIHSETSMTPPTAPPTDHPMMALSSYKKDELWICNCYFIILIPTC